MPAPRLLCLAMLLTATGAVAAEVVVVVAAHEPAPVLSRAEVSNIFLGKLSRFPDGRPARPIDQPEGSPARISFYREVGDKTPAEVKAYWSKMIFTGRGQPPPVADGDEAVKKLLTSRPGTIGYVERAAVDARLHVLAVR